MTVMEYLESAMGLFIGVYVDGVRIEGVLISYSEDGVLIKNEERNSELFVRMDKIGSFKNDLE